MEIKKENNNLDQVFLNCVKWDILNAIMEEISLVVGRHMVRREH
jgi:hypothetical protein